MTNQKEDWKDLLPTIWHDLEVINRSHKDYERDSLLHNFIVYKVIPQIRKETLEEVTEIIRQRMRDFANTPLYERKDAFEEMVELNHSLDNLMKGEGE